MNFWYSIVDPEDKYGRSYTLPVYDYVQRIPEYYTDDDIDDVINSIMRKHGVDEIWYAIEKNGKYISSGVTAICRPV
tara:strand:- start:1730 stop:1960 length:231 start_codon:yes stop_codon:yes gene_type:complete